MGRRLLNASHSSLTTISAEPCALSPTTDPVKPDDDIGGPYYGISLSVIGSDHIGSLLSLPDSIGQSPSIKSDLRLQPFFGSGINAPIAGTAGQGLSLPS